MIERDLLQLDTPVYRRPRARISAPIFVVGCPRSGTTVLGNCLGAHSALAGADESIFLNHLSWIFYGLFHGANQRGWMPLRTFTSEDILIEAMGDFADRIFSTLLERQKKKRYVDHTPNYVRSILLIDALYPDSKFIHIIRDGRDVAESLADSYKKGYQWAGGTIAARATYWAENIFLGRKAGSQLPPDRYKEVFYEKLCHAPVSTLETVTQFVGLRMEPDVLRPLAYEHANPSRSNVTLAKYNGSGQVEICPRVVGNRWPLGWTDEQRSEFHKVAGETLRALGYAS